MWEAVAAITVAALGVVAELVRRAHRRSQKPREAIRDHAHIYDELQGLRHTLRANRIVVVKTHNGGGLPSAKTQLYTSALYEVADAARPVKGYWQGLTVDAPYVQVLSAMMEQGSAAVDVAALGPRTTLADIYASGDIKTAHEYYLYHDARGLYYLSLQWRDASHEASASQRLAIAASVRKISKTLSEA